jgi:hypothetical protein
VIIPIAGLLALLSPILAGGRLSRYADVRLRHGWIVVTALLAQIVIIEIVPEAAHAVLSGVHLATYAAAGAWVWLNRRIPGLWIVALGAACNGVTIALNGGTLPASRRALEGAGLTIDPNGFVNSGVLDSARLPWLGDVFWIPESWPLANVFSIGDVLIVVGIGWGVHRVSGSRLVPDRWRWQPPAQTAHPPQQSAQPEHVDTPDFRADTPEVQGRVAFLPAPAGEALE